MAKEKNNREHKLTKEIELPNDVSASIEGKSLLVKGSKGEVSKTLKQHNVQISIDNKKILLKFKRETRKDKKIVGSLVAHIINMIKGSSENHIYILKICSGHFPMNVSASGNNLTIKNFIGEKVPRTLQLKHDASVKIEGDLIYVTSTSKETAGQVAADIEQLTRRPGYDPRIFQDGIYLINKDGEELK